MHDSKRFSARINSFTGRLTLIDNEGLEWEQVATRYYTSGHYGIYFGLEDKNFVAVCKGEAIGTTDTFAHAADLVFNHWLWSL